MTDTHPELTLSDVTWLTALARSLTRDGAEADDLVQETWIAASASPPADGAVNRAWLARVLRNFHLKSLRSQDRRSRREQVASRAESQPSSADLVEAAELRRNLADGLLALAEPYRTTLMRVAFEGQTARQIAEVEGVSVGVVRHRLRQARELYKQELDRRCEGEGSRWYAALLPFADLPLPGDAATAEAAGGVTVAAAVGGLVVSIQTLVAVSAAALVGLFLWLLQAPAAEPQERTQALEADGQVAAWPKDQGPAPAFADRAPPPSRTPRAPASTVATEPIAAATDPGPATVRLTGRLVYRDELGALLPDPRSGSFSFEASERAPARTVSVHAGAFAFDVPSGWVMDLHRGARFEGRAAQMLDFDQKVGPFTADAELLLEARRLAPVPIEALDADTGEHLRGVQVAERDWIGAHPGLEALEDLRVTGADSPLQVQLLQTRATSFYLSAPGYPWTPLEVDPFAEGVRRVLLSRGSANLEVRVEGLADDPCELTLWNKTSLEKTTHFALDPDGLLRVERLAPGEYQLDARSGSLLASTTLVLEPGDQVVTLELQLPDKPVASLSGSLSLPAEWELGDFTLELVGDTSTLSLPRGELLQDPRAPELWSLPARPIEPGTYSARIEDIGWFTWIEVDGGPLWLDVPVPRTVNLRVIDASSGQPLDPEAPGLQVSWAALSEGYRIRTAGIDHDPRTGTWSFRAPLGPIGVYAKSPEFDGELELDLSTYGTDVELEAYRTGRLVIDLFDGGTEVPPPDEFWIYRTALESADGTPARIADFIQADGEIFIQVSRAGLYLLEVAAINGYGPIPPAQIEVKAGEVLRHRIDLERE
jgi:RNA polymerase sigma-70 factor (ECF subfamily)